MWWTICSFRYNEVRGFFSNQIYFLFKTKPPSWKKTSRVVPVGEKVINFISIQTHGVTKAATEVGDGVGWGLVERSGAVRPGDWVAPARRRLGDWAALARRWLVDWAVAGVAVAARSGDWAVRTRHFSSVRVSSLFGQRYNGRPCNWIDCIPSSKPLIHTNFMICIIIRFISEE